MLRGSSAAVAVSIFDLKGDLRDTPPPRVAPLLGETAKSAGAFPEKGERFFFGEGKNGIEERSVRRRRGDGARRGK